jgi:hypothetical protein
MVMLLMGRSAASIAQAALMLELSWTRVTKDAKTWQQPSVRQAF